MSWVHKFFKFREQSDEEVVKPFLEHLEDLRWTLIKMALSLVGGMIVAFIWVKDVTALLRAPLEALQGKEPLITLNVTDAFMISLQIAFYAGILISFPLLIFFLAEFVLPALTRREKKLLLPAIGGGFVLFGVGVLLAYLYILPMTLAWFRNYALGMGLDPRWQARDYFSFVTHLMVACGLLCELPVGMLALSILGILRFQFLQATRPYAYTLILILVALISPTPDPVTFLVMSIPVLAIYEGCIWLVWLIERRRSQELAEPL